MHTDAAFPNLLRHARPASPSVASVATYAVGVPSTAVRLLLLIVGTVVRGLLAALLLLFVAGTVGMIVAWVGSLFGGLAGALIDIPLPADSELGDAWVAVGGAVGILYLVVAAGYDLLHRRRAGMDLGIGRHLRRGRALFDTAMAQVAVDRAAAKAINETLDGARVRDLIRVEGRRPKGPAIGPWTRRPAASPLAWPAAILGPRTKHRRGRLGEPELTIEPFVGWRRWSVAPGSLIGLSPTEPLLTGVVISALWDGPEIEARCSPHQRWPSWGPAPPAHPAPALDCRCGIYAMKQPEFADWVGVGIWAEGPVQLWGRVLEGTKGYRAERARILGPLALRMGCRWPRTPETWLAHACPEPPERVVIEAEEYVPLCRQHSDVIPREQLAIEEFVELLATGLGTRYEIEVVERSQLWT